MTSPSDQKPGRPPRPSREWIPLVALLLALLLAAGPGVLLVNRPTTVFGLPLVYAWGIFWFFVMGGIALATDRFIWRKEAQKAELEGESERKEVGDDR